MSTFAKTAIVHGTATADWTSDLAAVVIFSLIGLIVAFIAARYGLDVTGGAG